MQTRSIGEVGQSSLNIQKSLLMLRGERKIFSLKIKFPHQCDKEDVLSLLFFILTRIVDIEFLSGFTNEEEDVSDQGKSLFCQQYTHTHRHALSLSLHFTVRSLYILTYLVISITSGNF